MTISKILSLFVLAFLASSCSTEEEVMVVSNRGPAQGTIYNITYLAPPGVDYRTSIDSILFVLDKSMSLWQETSVISRLNSGDTLQSQSAEVEHFLTVFRASNGISQKSKGAFDISVAPLVNYWGFGPDAKSSLDSSVADSIRNFVGFERLKVERDNNKLYLPKGMKVDMNAIAQGYSVDVIADFLNQKGVHNYLIELGGEIRTRGRNIKNNVWTIGVNKPSENEKIASQLQVIVGLDSLSLATSGNYRKFWVDESTGMKYVHTIDPKTGYPVKSRLLSVTVVTKDCMRADAWATACMVVGLEKAKTFIEQQADLEAYFVYSSTDGQWKIWQSEGFEKITK